MRLGERRQFKSSSHLYSQAVTVNFFRLCWIVLIIWAELGVFYWSLSSCKWPELPFSSEKPTRVLLVADPQVQCPLTNEETQPLLRLLRRSAFNLNLKKSWHVTSRLRPHVVVFLGDMLASGWFTKDETEYQRHFQKFKDIFTFPPISEVFYLPGNNDVGMGMPPSASKSIREYYSHTFGPFNQQINIRNHTMVLIDAPGLVDEDYQRAGYGVGFDDWNALPNGTAAFVKEIPRSQQPLFLFSHIPLARPDSASCGPRREKGTIRKGVGHGYQNTLGKHTTSFLLKTLHPSAVYSGDNRDYCEYLHISKNKPENASADVTEVTVKSFSMANHIRHPGFQLLSLVDPFPNNTRPSFRDVPCTLPNQSGIYLSVYLPFLAFTLCALAVLSMIRQRQARLPLVEPLHLSPQSSGENTPNPQPESAIWSAHTPKAPGSPTSSLPSYLRTPTTLVGPTLRASRPATPAGSPLLPPMYYTQEEDEDSMYPAQYATRRVGDYEPNSRRREWLPSHDADLDPETHTRKTHFTFAPGLKPATMNRRWSWSWSFVLRGRRRRITIKPPSWSWTSFRDLLQLLVEQNRTPTQRHHVLRNTLRDGLSTLWPALITWSLLLWWI